MSTPVINAIDNVNDATLNNLFQAVANNASARENLSQSNRNIDAVASNTSAAAGLGDNAGQDEAVRLCLCRRTGRDPANFPNTDTDIVQNGTFRSEIFGDSTLSQLVSESQPGMAEIASSATFSSELAASQTAMQEIAASQTARDEVIASQTAMQEVAASQPAMQEVAASQPAMQEVASSQTAMQEVAPSQTAMQEVAASQTAMQEVAASQTAMTEIDQVDFAVRAIMCGTTTLDPTNFANADAISQDAGAMSEIAGDATTMGTLAASQTAMQEVAASQTAMQEVGLSGVAQTEVLGSGTARTELDNASTTSSFSEQKDRGSGYRIPIPATDEGYDVYIRFANYTGATDGQGCIQNAGWYGSGSSFGTSFSGQFVDTLAIGWDEDGTGCGGTDEPLSGEINALTF